MSIEVQGKITEDGTGMYHMEMAQWQQAITGGPGKDEEGGVACLEMLLFINNPSLLCSLSGIEMTGTGSCGITSIMSKISFDLLDSQYRPGIPLFGKVGNFWDPGQQMT